MVYVTEGEKDVLALESVGAAATCSAMGAGKADKFDWSPLHGKNVIIVADNDEPGRKHAGQVAECLAGKANSVRIVEAAVGKDAADHIAAGQTLDGFVTYRADCIEVTPRPFDGAALGEDEDERPQRRSVAAQLVDLARAHYQLGVTDTDDPFGVTEEQPHIALMLRGGKTGLRAELSRRHFAETNTVASQQALSDACMVLEGFAAQESPQRVHLRVGEAGGAVYIDMGDTAGRVIEISGGRWRITDTAPVLFRRTKLTGQLPDPQTGNLAALWEFIGVAEADRPIVLAVLVAALVQVDVPHVILVLLAEQGSAKSTATRILVSLIDPSAVPLRQPPRDPDAWTTAAAASWVVALDNLSGEIPGWLSDSLCRASTGDGRVTRALYTDSDVSVLSFRRCLIANGIDVVVDKGDLAERVAVVGLPRVKARRSEDELAEAWEQARPRVLGALLDLAAAAHHRLPAIKVDNLPRMADFAKVLAAVDEVLGTNGLNEYRERSRRAAVDTLDGPFISELVACGQAFNDMTSAELLAAIKPDRADWKPPRGWPKNARAVTGLLTRHAPALRAQGWTVDNDGGRNKANSTRWNLKGPGPEKVPIPNSPNSPNSSSQVSDEKAGESEASQASYAVSVDSPREKSLTSRNELGEQGELETPPLSADLCGCGNELTRPESVARGRCAECAVSDPEPVR